MFLRIWKFDSLKWFLPSQISGAVSYDLLGQAQKYVEDLVLNPKYDFFGSWKILTIFIGINDLCSCCRPKHRVKYSPAKYVKGKQAFRHVKEHQSFTNQKFPYLQRVCSLISNSSAINGKLKNGLL